MIRQEDLSNSITKNFGGLFGSFRSVFVNRQFYHEKYEESE